MSSRFRYTRAATSASSVTAADAAELAARSIAISTAACSPTSSRGRSEAPTSSGSSAENALTSCSDRAAATACNTSAYVYSRSASVSRVPDVASETWAPVWSMNGKDWVRHAASGGAARPPWLSQTDQSRSMLAWGNQKIGSGGGGVGGAKN